MKLRKFWAVGGGRRGGCSPLYSPLGIGGAQKQDEHSSDRAMPARLKFNTNFTELFFFLSWLFLNSKSLLIHNSNRSSAHFRNILDGCCNPRDDNPCCVTDWNLFCSQVSNLKVHYRPQTNFGAR